MTARAAAFLGAALGVAATLGCGAAVEPERTVDHFARALREGHYSEAYELMSNGYRRRVSYEDFVASLEDNPRETRDAASALGRVAGPSEQVAVVSLSDGERVELAREGGEWRIASNVVDFYDQSTPRAALRSFVRAMERERYDVVLRMVPNADREGMTVERMREAWSGEGREEIERLLENLRSSLDAPIEQVGDRATMAYGDRFTAQLLREEGIWKIEDPD